MEDDNVKRMPMMFFVSPNAPDLELRLEWYTEYFESMLMSPFLSWKWDEKDLS